MPLEAIVKESDRIGFTMSSEPRTGSLLRALAASKPGGRVLELGTGTGVGTAWLLAGMDAAARLESVESDSSALEIARRHLGRDPRVTFHSIDGAAFLAAIAAGSITTSSSPTPGRASSRISIWPWDSSAPGGIFLVDDLLPQPNWPDGHGAKVDALIEDLERPRGVSDHVTLAWASGLMMLVRT